MMRIVSILILMTAVSFTCFSQVPSGQAKFSLLTCAPGDMAQDAWGHSAIRFFDPTNRIDEVYNYGTYDFAADNFILNFLKGKLDYDLASGPMANFIRVYDYYERSVWEQDFDLDASQVKELYLFLGNNSLPENRTYQYDFFYDNCSTRIRNMLRYNLSGFNYSNQLEDKITFRQLLDVDLEYRDWTDFGIDLILGATCDVDANFEQTMFLPNFLSDNLEEARFNKSNSDSKLISNHRLILDHNERGNLRKTSALITPIILFSFLAFLELLIFLFRDRLNLRVLKIYDFVWILILAISSIIMMLMWFATEHVTCEQNWNLLWANPGYIPMLFLFWKPNSKSRYYLVWFIIGCTALALLGWWLIPQQYHIVFIPIMITLLLKLVRLK